MRSAACSRTFALVARTITYRSKGVDDGVRHRPLKTPASIVGFGGLASMSDQRALPIRYQKNAWLSGTWAAASSQIRLITEGRATRAASRGGDTASGDHMTLINENFRHLQGRNCGDIRQPCHDGRSAHRRAVPHVSPLEWSSALHVYVLLRRT